MIDWFINAWMNVIALIITQMFPVLDLSSFSVQYIAPISAAAVDNYNGWDAILPVHEAVGSLGLFMAFLFAFWVWNVFNYIKIVWLHI